MTCPNDPCCSRDSTCRQYPSRSRSLGRRAADRKAILPKGEEEDNIVLRMQQALANRAPPNASHKVQTDRLYIGNLPARLDDLTGKQFFSAAAAGAGIALAPGDPVVACWIAPEGPQFDRYPRLIPPHTPHHPKPRRPLAQESTGSSSSAPATSALAGSP